jgi:hypothetical protein
MAHAKQVTIRAKVNNTVVFDKTISGKKYALSLFRECLEFLDTVGGNAVIRKQVVGARSWSHWTYTAGDNQAYLTPDAQF